MNFTETIKSGQHYRVFDKLNNDGTRHYNRYSFVTNASDVIFEDGTNVEAKLGGSSGSLAAINKEIADLKKSVNSNNNSINDSIVATNKEIDELKKSVSDGKTLVANAITAKGVSTATNSTFTIMASNIEKIKVSNPPEEFIKYFIPNSVSTAYTEDSNTITYNVSELNSISWEATIGFGENEDGDSRGWVRLLFNDEEIMYFNNWDGDQDWSNVPYTQYGTFDCSEIDSLKVEYFVHSATSRWAAGTFTVTNAT